MDQLKEAKNLIDGSKNIYIIPSQDREESIAGALALFYTLKELGKNVNLILENIPEKLSFLTPSLDHISYPRNFILSIPNTKANVSEIHYEKDDNNLNIHLTTESGNIKKTDISFYFSSPRADILVSIGAKYINTAVQENVLKQVVSTSTAIINIDNQPENKISAQINLLDNARSLTENVFDLIKMFGDEIINKNNTQALLTGVIIASNNFQKPDISPEILELASFLIRKGGSRQQIVDNLFKSILVVE